ncbi:SGNH/GDSL hydrolase family protein [Cellulophaga baltica]|uniref:SGNH/GDSL hydrolase family protein n=1 Tax=Cellulophaga baltica TaxID=76594 RepID=UPI0021497797|nr:SGNH/GDSL hydrolase family protein [Cellulophaga baltica]MCR1025951.1 SGNH/GDSL hydrolase family protein [Cellulophaga baltica]
MTIAQQDWPNLKRFAVDNELLPAASPLEDRVVFMGDSITQGWLDYGCPELFKNYPYINRGISGQTTPQMLLRFRTDVLNLQPKIVVILAGINDIAGNTGPSTLKMIQDNIISMVQLAQANSIKVILSSILPADRFTWQPGINPADAVIQMNEFLKTYAKNHRCYYLDYYSSLVNESKGMIERYSEDGVHPTIAGYKVMTPLVLEAINEVVQKQN